jgi:hypothetical protein
MDFQGKVKNKKALFINYIQVCIYVCIYIYMYICIYVLYIGMKAFLKVDVLKS